MVLHHIRVVSLAVCVLAWIASGSLLRQVDTPIPLLRDTLWATNGTVSAVAQEAGTLYIGGSFSYVGPPTGSFAVLPDNTISPDTSFPRVEGAIFAVVSDEHGGWYIGGDFTAVDGMPRAHVAHIRADKSIDPLWMPAVDRVVVSLALNNNVVFIGG